MAETAEVLRVAVGTATITGAEPYQVHVTDDFRPWRLRARFHPWTPIDAKPLVDQLTFVTDPQHWGLPFRRGLFAIPAVDFHAIARAQPSE